MYNNNNNSNLQNSSNQYNYSGNYRSASQPQLYMNQIKNNSISTIKDYLKGYMDSKGMFPEYLAHKKLLSTAQDRSYEDSLLQNKVPGLDRMYRNMDNTMSIIQNKELELQNELKHLGNYTTEYDKRRAQQLHLQRLRDQAYDQKDIYNSSLSMSQVYPTSQLQQSKLINLNNNNNNTSNSIIYYDNNNINRSDNGNQGNVFLLNNNNSQTQPLSNQYINSSGYKDAIRNQVLTNSILQPQNSTQEFNQNYKMEHGFVLRLDFITALPYNYKSVQIFMEFHIQEEKDVKYSFAQNYPVENETLNSKRCIPYFSNIFKLFPHPNLKLFIECWGYQQKIADVDDQPIGKSWTKFDVFDSNGLLQVGRFKLPFYTINSNQEHNKYIFSERYLDNSFLNIRVSIPNDPVLDTNTRKFNPNQYAIPNSHSYQVEEKNYYYDEDTEDYTAKPFGYDVSKRGAKVINYEDIFPVETQNQQQDYNIRSNTVMFGQPRPSQNFQNKVREIEQLKQEDRYFEEKGKYGTRDFDSEYFAVNPQTNEKYYPKFENAGRNRYPPPIQHLTSNKKGISTIMEEDSISDKVSEAWSSQKGSENLNQNNLQKLREQNTEQSSVSSNSQRINNTRKQQNINFEDQQQSEKSSVTDHQQFVQQNRKSQESEQDQETEEPNIRNDILKLNQENLNNMSNSEDDDDDDDSSSSSSEEQEDSDLEFNKIQDSQKALYIELSYIQDMHDTRALKYRVKLIGESQYVQANISGSDAIKDRSGNKCDFKGSLEVHKKDKRQQYFECQQCFNVTKDDILKQKLRVIIELYAYDKNEKFPIYEKFGELEHNLIKDKEEGTIMEGKFERSIFQRHRFKIVRSAMEFGYFIFRDIYKEDKKYQEGIVLQIKLNQIMNFETEQQRNGSSVSCDVSLLMDRSIIQDDNGDVALYNMKDKAIPIGPMKANGQTTVQFGSDYDLEFNVDLDELRTMNRGNLYLFYVIFILKISQRDQRTDYGWFAHPLFKDMVKFNTGKFSKLLWRPPPILDAPYDSKDYKHLQASLNFEINYVLYKRKGNVIKEDPVVKIQKRFQLERQKEMQRRIDLGLQNRYVKIDIKSVDKVDKLVKNFTLQQLIMNDTFILEDKFNEELVLEFDNLVPDEEQKAPVNNDFTIKIEYNKLQKMNKQKTIYYIANILKNEQVLFWTIIPLFDKKTNEVPDGERHIQPLFYPPLQKISEFNPKKARKSNTLLKYIITVGDFFDDLE